MTGILILFSPENGPDPLKESETEFVKETRSSPLKDITLNINPPAYTGVASYSTKDPNISIPEGSGVVWQIVFSDSVQYPHLVFLRQVSVAGDTVLNLYISQANEWQSLAVTNALENTRQAASSKPSEKKFKDVFLPVAPWMFYLLFLLGAGWLWLAPKL